MALDVGDQMGPVALEGSVLYVDANIKLAQDNADFYYDPATNTLKSKNQPTAATSSFNIATGNVTAGDGSSTSGALAINTGAAQPNSSGSGSAGNSGTVTLSTGAGGAASGGSNPGVSGNLLLKTGTGGGNAAASSTGGNAGHIILQPGDGGSGTSGPGSGGSTVVRASTSGGDILSVQNNAGSSVHFGVSNSGNVRVGTASSAARLHLGGGTTSLPPLKFDSGSLLTSPATGALEWDGSEFYRTNATARRPLETSLEVANVLDFGAKGDDDIDDSAAFQAAVDSLVDTGGIVWVPPGGKYVVGNVTIAAKYPVWIMSAMGGHGSTAILTTASTTAQALRRSQALVRRTFLSGLDTSTSTTRVVAPAVASSA
jgi:hypothetical protein